MRVHQNTWGRVSQAHIRDKEKTMWFGCNDSNWGFGIDRKKKDAFAMIRQLEFPALFISHQQLKQSCLNYFEH